MKRDELSTVAWHSFDLLSALVLRMLLDIDGIKGISRLIIFVGINGLLMMLKPAASIADAITYELLLLLLITTTQKIFSKIMRESNFY